MKSLAKLAVYAMRAVYFFFKLFLKPRNKIALLSRQSDNLSIDFALLKGALQEIGFKGEIVALCKKIPDSLVGKLAYVFHIAAQMYHIATAKVVVVDGYSIAVCVLKHKKETKVIQIWHALSAVKKFGYQSLGTDAGSDKDIARIMCMHKNYDYVLASGEIIAEHYKEAFNVDGAKIKYLGMPRIDYILKRDGDISKRIYERYPRLKEKTNILYVPTFRKDQGVKLDELVQKIDTSKYNLIIKLHPVDTKTVQPEREGVFYDSEFAVYDLVKISHKVITDYSSLAMEVSLLEVPIYFYVYDIEKYIKSPGLNFEFENEEIAVYKAEKAEDLLNKIEENYDFEILKRFREKYIAVDTKDCAVRLAHFIEALITKGV